MEILVQLLINVLLDGNFTNLLNIIHIKLVGFFFIRLNVVYVIGKGAHKYKFVNA